ncbi:MAG: HTTM domain-containing protein [Myxococcota bacterium]
MKRVEDFFFGGVDPIRPWLLLRILLLMLAFDCWLDLIPHGGRYGFNEFNVSHFAWLDALQPLPTSGTYVGTMVLTGLLAFVMAVTRPSRAGVFGVFALYTYGWLMSMLDSYQHHYLLSLLLLNLTFFPMHDSAAIFERGVPPRNRSFGGLLFSLGVLEVLMGLSGVDSPLTALVGPGAAVETPTWVWGFRFAVLLLGGLLAFLPEKDQPTRTPQPDKSDEPTTTSAWAYVSFCVTCGVVYFYTFVGKLPKDWREGHALRRLQQTELSEALETHATTEGLPLVGVQTPEEFWALMAAGAIAVQLVSCVGFVLASTQDRWPWPPRRRMLVMLAFLVAPLSFHLGAEAGLGLDIGWFSFYMMAVALVVFLPATVLRTMVYRATLPVRAISVRLQETTSRATVVAALVLACAAVLGVGRQLDLPGAWSASLLVATAIGVLVAIDFRTPKRDRAGSLALGLALGALLMGWTVVHSDVRFDFYRFVGGEYRRHGEPARALAAYEKANAYVDAPWCVYRGRDLVECYREESEGEQIAERYRDLRLQRRDRQRQEDEMRRVVEGNAGGS